MPAAVSSQQWTTILCIPLQWVISNGINTFTIIRTFTIIDAPLFYKKNQYGLPGLSVQPAPGPGPQSMILSCSGHSELTLPGNQCLIDPTGAHLPPLNNFRIKSLGSHDKIKVLLCLTMLFEFIQIYTKHGSGNGLLPAGTKPLLEPKLTYHQ